MANLFAVHEPSAPELDDAERRLVESGEFDVVWRPTEGWVAGRRDLPGSADAEGWLDALGATFAEGRDRVESAAGAERTLREGTERAHAALEGLPGDFGFIRFVPDGSATVVRSCAGLVPFYTFRRPTGGIAVGTALRYFPRLLPERMRPDPLISAAAFSAMRFIDGRTFVEGVTILPPGSVTRLGDGRAPAPQRYWDPRPTGADALRPSAEHATRFRELLLATLERDLDPSGMNLLTLSGGVDSSVVGALAAGTVGRPLASWSLIPSTEPELSHELSFIEPLVRGFGIEPMLRCEVDAEYIERGRRRHPALPFHVPHPALRELALIVEDHPVRVLVGGEFGDEVGGHWVRLNDWTLHTSLASLVSGRAPKPFGSRRDYGRWFRRRVRNALGRPLTYTRRGLPAWTPDTVREEYTEWFESHRRAIGADRRPLRELAERVGNDLWVAMNWEATTALGVRRSLPFFNREMLELAFECHPWELFDGAPRRLMRDAVGDDVPARYLNRLDKGQWGHGAQEAERRMARRVYDFEDDEGGIPREATRIARAEWLPEAPADAAPAEVVALRLALQAAGFLERSTEGREDGWQTGASARL